MLCQRIHKLDEMSKRVLEDVESLEVEVNNAEANLTNNTEGKLKNILKPLLFVSIPTIKCDYVINYCFVNRRTV